MAAPLSSLTCPSVSKSRTGRPCPSQTIWSLEIRPSFVRPIRSGESPFEQACRRAVSLEMGGVDHQGAIKRCFVCQLSENFIENTEPAPPDKAVVQHCVRASSGASCH